MTCEVVGCGGMRARMKNEQGTEERLTNTRANEMQLERFQVRRFKSKAAKVGGQRSTHVDALTPSCMHVSVSKNDKLIRTMMMYGVLRPGQSTVTSCLSECVSAQTTSPCMCMNQKKTVQSVVNQLNQGVSDVTERTDERRALGGCIIHSERLQYHRTAELWRTP